MVKRDNFTIYLKWFLLIFALAIFNVGNPPRLLSLILIIALVPAYYISFRIFGSEAQHFSPIILVSIYFGTSFAVGSYIYASFQNTISNESYLVFKVSSLSVVGVYSMIFGAFVLKKLKSFSTKTVNQNLYKLHKVPILFLLIIGWLSRFSIIRSGRYFHLSNADLVQTTTRTSFISTSLTVLPTIVFCICLGRYLRGNFKSRIQIGMMFTSEIIYHLFTGSRQSLLVPFVAFIFVWTSNGRKIPRFRFLQQIFIFFVAILTLAFITDYRVNRFRTEESPLISIIQTGQTFLKDGLIHQLQISFLTVFERASDVISMGLAYSMPRSDLQGIIHNPFSIIPSTLIPRILNPNKIDYALVGNEFGRAVGLLNPGDFFTSIDYPIPLEGYLWNGIFGLIMVCSFSGMIYFAIHYFIFINRNDLKDSVYASTLLGLFNSPAQILAHGIFGWIKSAMFLYLFLVVVNKFFLSIQKKLEVTRL